MNQPRFRSDRSTSLSMNSTTKTDPRAMSLIPLLLHELRPKVQLRTGDPNRFAASGRGLDQFELPVSVLVQLVD
jgi:hypothetical protein